MTMVQAMPSQHRLSLCLALLVSLVPLVVSQKKTWTLYHAWKGHDFTKRGQVSLSLDQDEPTLLVQNDVKAPSLPIEALYQLKLVEDGNESVYTLTSVPACQVHRANFRDEITLTLNNRASVISMDYIPLVSPLAPACNEIIPKGEAMEFKSKIEMETATPGMSVPAVLPGTKPPPGLKVLKNPNAKQNGGGAFENEQQQQEPITTPQGFIRRYWYIILPLFIMGLQSVGETPQEGEQQEGKAGTRGQAQGASAAPAPAATQPTGKARRGKRN